MTSAAPVAETVPTVALREISKSFGGIEAVKAASMSLFAGEVHALVGENGAGKSTLAKIVSGVVSQDSGQVLVDGTERRFRSPSEALTAGVATVQQELTLIPQLGVAENVFLGSETSRWHISRRSLERRLEALEADVGFGVPHAKAVRQLSVAQRKVVELLRAVAHDARVLVLDEPTAVLSGDEALRLHGLLVRLKERGCAVLYVSHWLDEVLAVADQITVMRNGVVVQTTPASGQTSASLALAMLGRNADLSYPAPRAVATDSPVVLELSNASRRGAFDAIDLTLHQGEIYGLAGLVGSGRTEIARAVFGADRLDTGTVSIGGRVVRLRSPVDAVKAGIAMIPENRKESGVLLNSSVRDNIALAYLGDFARFGVVQSQKLSRTVSGLLEELDIRPRDPSATVRRLSGGNQQKTLFARWQVRRPKLLILDEPTAGVDIGAKSAIHRMIAELADSGLAVLLISSDLDEVIGLSSSIAVLRRGRLVATFAHAPFDHDQIAVTVLGGSGDE